MRAATSAIARGSTVQATLAFIRDSFGAATLESIMGKLDVSVRKRVEDAAMTDELPYELLLTVWRAADEALRGSDPSWMERAGSFAIDSLGQQLYGGLLRKASPTEFVTQSVSLFRLYYAPGDMVLVEVESTRAVVRLVDFPAIGPLFCQRQTGGLRRATELAGGRDVRVTHVRCEHEGDAFCEWELRWSSAERPSV
jgi:hypothetical protein